VKQQLNGEEGKSTIIPEGKSQGESASCEVLYVLGIKVIIDTRKFGAMGYYGDIYV
jgi:hypothetical protein